MKHKFNAVPKIIDGRRFDSKLEANYYRFLKEKVKLNEVVFFLMQVPFHLPAKIKYVCDFQVFNTDGSIDFIDVKGKDTPISILKRKQVEEIYPVKIKIVTKNSKGKL